MGVDPGNRKGITRLIIAITLLMTIENGHAGYPAAAFHHRTRPFVLSL